MFYFRLFLFMCLDPRSAVRSPESFRMIHAVLKSRSLPLARESSCTYFVLISRKSQHSGFSSIISIQNEASFLKFETSTEYILHVAQQIDLPFHDSLTMYKIVHCMLRNKSNYQCRVMSHSPKCTLFLALQLQRSWDAAPRALGEPRARSRTRTLECNITEHA